MNDTNDTYFSRRMTVQATARALLLAAAAVTFAGPAIAQAGAGQAPAGQSSTDQVLVDTIDAMATQASSLPAAAMSLRGAGASDAAAGSARSADAGEMAAAADDKPLFGLFGGSDDKKDHALPPPPEVNVAPVQGVEFYGPPSPKQVKGKLPDIAWPEAPKFVPPALDDAVRIVTKNYPSATAARSALRAAASDVRAAKWLRFPSFAANVGFLDGGANTRRGPDPQLTVELPIWTGGRISSQIRRSKAGEDASSAEYVEMVQNLAVQTSQTYFEIARLTLREQLLADSLKEHQRLVETMERRVGQEVSPLADLELARSRAAQIETQYTVTRSLRQQALRLMAQLVADPTYDLGPVPYFDRTLDLPDRNALEDQAAAYDPTIRRLQAEADIARAERDATKASIFPQLNAQYSYDDFYHSRVGVALKAQTTGGLSQLSQVESARLRIDAALEQSRVAEEELRRQVATDVIDYDSSKERASISLGASDTAGKVSASYMRQFIAGRRSWLDVMNALREAVTAQIDRVDAEIGTMQTAVRLLLASGRWRPEFPDQSSPDKN